MSELFEAAEEIIDEAFPPKPGGLVDRHRQRKARDQAAADKAKENLERIEQPSARAVKVAVQSPEVVSAQTFTIAAGNYVQILPASPYRCRAIILVLPVTGQTPQVVLAKDSGAALGGTGMLVTAGIPIDSRTRAQVYAQNNTANPVQVSVMAEIYAPEIS